MMPGRGFPVPPGLASLGVGRRAGRLDLLAARPADGGPHRRRVSAVLAQSLGFRQYLVTAEANQIRWEEAQDIFSRFLPFAIVFGVAERWAATFEEVAAAAAAAGHAIA